ncbi:hypothetical protein TSAR_011832 [Trichomalopsis sarcophagae]|uniref:C2H2-type domain-containing protein n=1 Tax=Trichomalopsis sarcophagae TaxID=543379 RepID=A0A232F6E2_9HYME|nr:hypothetical protein TSAR_011832 [Trichomalopsis sarcophagae]
MQKECVLACTNFVKFKKSHLKNFKVHSRISKIRFLILNEKLNTAKKSKSFALLYNYYNNNEMFPSNINVLNVYLLSNWFCPSDVFNHAISDTNFMKVEELSYSLEDDITVKDENPTIMETAFIKEEFTYCSDDESTLSAENIPDKKSSKDKNIFIYRKKFKEEYCSFCRTSFLITKEPKKYQIRKCLDCQTDLKYQCGRCKKQYKYVSQLRFHLNYQCNQQPQFFCADCEYKTTNKSLLVAHLRCMHMDYPRSHLCSKCPKMYKHKSHLLRHERRCSIKFVCQYCFHVTTSEACLKPHVRSVHFIAPGRAFNFQMPNLFFDC